MVIKLKEDKLKDKLIKKKLLGDFQTPSALARTITELLVSKNVNPASIIEPNCGTGVFIASTLYFFPGTDITGFDISSNYTTKLQQKYSSKSSRVSIHMRDFFTVNWKEVIGELDTPVLIIGNPPWVTSAEVTSLEGSNLPAKSNIHGFKGLDAVTGSSNFDISEWMIIKLLEALIEHSGDLAMICKTSTARKVLHHAFRTGIQLCGASMYLIDSMKHFNASVSSCLLHCRVNSKNGMKMCSVFNDLGEKTPFRMIGYDNGQLIADWQHYSDYNHLTRKKSDKSHTWRSGIKHDCSKVMEFKKIGDKLMNGFGEEVILESDYLYPLLKSSDLANNRLSDINRWMLVTQTRIGEQTSSIREMAPLTWNYLEKYSNYLDNRASSVYHNRPRYSIFGTGPYAFSSWKIAISGFYKRIKFRLLRPFHGKPVVLDDTCYFLPLNSLTDTIVLTTALNQPVVTKFLNSFIFWDAKRPVTKKMLQKIDISALLVEIGLDGILDAVEGKYSGISSENLAISFKRFTGEF